MATELETVYFGFDDITGHEYVESESVIFDGRVTAAETAIQSFKIGYDGEGHNVRTNEIHTDADVNGDSVRVNLRALFRDNSGHIDDPYSGQIRVLVVAKTE
jgi:hypothetical protein